MAQLFLAAHKVRYEVFVKEQHCSAANEIDTDDARSWHWIIYAPSSPPPKDQARAWPEPAQVGKAPVEEGPVGGWHHHLLPVNNNKDKTDNDINNTNNKFKHEESGSVIPVATTRLVPFSPSPSPSPPPPTAASPSREVGAGVAEQQQQQPPTHTETKMWNGKEAYIKLGRLATLPSHRGLGFGRVLIDSALKWAVENVSTLSLSSPVQRQQPRITEEQENEEEEKEEKGGNGWNGWNGLVLVHAQRDVEAWYRSVHGFVTDEDMGVWIEEEIEHVGMWRRLDLRGKGQGGKGDSSFFRNEE